MLRQERVTPRALRPTALLVAASLTAPLFFGCGSSKNSGANLPPIDETRGGQVTSTSAPAPIAQEPPRRGLSTNQKLVLLAGAAALYYLYKKHQNKQGEGQQGQYYLSKNGRVYYRDQSGRAHWVTPPPNGLRVPASEVQNLPELQQYRGYQGNDTGQDFGGLTQGRY
jgi:hypothetical protein